MTSHIVKGLIRKAGRNLLKSPEIAVKYLQLELAGGLSLLSLVEDRSLWEELSKGIGYRITRFAPTMPAEFVEWLVTMAPLEEWGQYSVHTALEKKNLYGKSSYDRLNLEDSEQWDKLAAAVGKYVAELTPTMGADFVDWLVRKTDKEKKWGKKSVYWQLLKPNSEGNIALAHIIDPNTWGKIAKELGPYEMAESASYMGAEFADWMWKKKDEEAWDKKNMYKGLIRVNKWGKAGLSHFADSSTWDEVAAVIGVEITSTPSAMGSEFVEWLLVKTDKEGWHVKQVYEKLIDGLAHCADKTIWNKVASVVGDDIARCASAMGPEFTEWLLEKNQEEEPGWRSWDEKYVYRKLVEVDAAGRTALAHFDDSSAWDEVAAVVGEDIAEAAVVMPGAFTEWLVQKTEEANWEKSEVWTRLCRPNEEHQTALSSLCYSPQMFTRLSSWAPQKGLHFRVYNVDLAEALLKWHTNLGAVGEEEKAEVLRTLIKKKGVVLEMVSEDNQVLAAAVNCWNERNKEISEKSLS